MQAHGSLLLLFALDQGLRREDHGWMRAHAGCCSNRMIAASTARHRQRTRQHTANQLAILYRNKGNLLFTNDPLLALGPPPTFLLVSFTFSDCFAVFCHQILQVVENISNFMDCSLYMKRRVSETSCSRRTDLGRRISSRRIYELP